MKYTELRDYLGLDPHDQGTWSREMETWYDRIPFDDYPDRDAPRHFCEGIAYERRRAQAERAQQVETVTAALREAHPVIGVEA